MNFTLHYRRLQITVVKKDLICGTRYTVTSDDGITVTVTDYFNNETETMIRAQQVIESERHKRKAESLM